MAQHDMDIANQGFPATRADLNNALQALVSNSSGATAPSTTFANQWWYDTTNNKMYLRNEANNAWIEVFALDQTNNEWQLVTGQISAADGDGIAFKTDDGTTRVTLDDSGNLLVGKTSASSSTVGFETKQTGFTAATRDANTCLVLNRLTSDGEIASFRKDGTTVGKIGNQGATPFFANNTTGGIRLGTSSGSTVIQACSETGAFENNLHDLGSGSNNWRNLYLGGGVYLGGIVSANYLDDYEEGSWTVNMYDAASGGNASSTQVTGRYVKIGQQVIASFDAFNNVSTSGLTAGNAVYFTLPFTASSTGRACGSCQLDTVSFPSSGTMVTTAVTDNASRATLNTSGSSQNDTTVKVSDFNGTSSDVVNWTLSYRTS